MVQNRALRVTGDELPVWMEGLSLDGVSAFGGRWRVRVEQRTAFVEPRQEPAAD